MSDSEIGAMWGRIAAIRAAVLVMAHSSIHPWPPPHLFDVGPWSRTVSEAIAKQPSTNHRATRTASTHHPGVTFTPVSTSSRVTSTKGFCHRSGSESGFGSGFGSSVGVDLGLLVVFGFVGRGRGGGA